MIYRKLAVCMAGIAGIFLLSDTVQAENTDKSLGEEELARIVWLSKNCPAVAEVVVQQRNFQYEMWNENKVEIPFTHLGLAVKEIVYNKAKSELENVYFPGGKIGENEIWFSHSPNDISPGDKLILFYGKYQDFISPCSGDIGVFKIENQMVHGTNLTVDEFKQIIRKEVSK